jgi:putative hemolysin
MPIFITSCLVAIIVSFLCSLTEAVLLSLNPIRLETLNQQGKAHASIWIKLRQNIGRPIAAILILNTIAHTGGATVAGSAFDEIYGDEWIWLFSIVFTIVILFGTEIFPKMIGVSFNEKLAPWIAPVLRASIAVLKPIIALTELLSRIFEQTENHTSRMGVEDIRTLARIAKTQGTIEDEQERIILSAAKLRETKVESAMIPREWIIFLRTHQSIEENFEIARNNLHTRYPISGSDTVDGIVGYVNFKEMALFEPNLSALSIAQFIRPVLFVANPTNLNTMLKLFIAKRHHLAIVKDARANVIGMVTLEDVIEEISGDIEDEFDEMSGQIIQIRPNKWRVGGSVRLEVLARQLEISFSSGDLSKTIAEWLHSKTNPPTYPGTTYSTGDVRFVVQQVRRGRIHQVIVETNSSPKKI